MRRILLSTLIYFLSLSGSTLLYNYLTMGKGYIWYEHFGSSLWNHLEWWTNYTLPAALFNSLWIGIVLSLLTGIIRRFSASKLFSCGLCLLSYIPAWIFIALQVSKTYIFEFGMTWRNMEIIKEVVFGVPIFTILMISISYGITYRLLRINNKHG